VQLNDVLAAKHVEILREIRPKLRRIGQLVDTNTDNCKLVADAVRGAAKTFGVTFVEYNVASKADIERAFLVMKEDPPEALLPCPSLMMLNYRDLLFESAVRLRIPFTSFIVTRTPTGVLFAYAASLKEMHRRAAYYVDRILKGAAPGDLPMEQPTTFELVVNLKTARDFGITVPKTVLVRADRVNE
jgi:putative ABC transport system substrate-binding protein